MSKIFVVDIMTSTYSCNRCVCPLSCFEHMLTIPPFISVKRTCIISGLMGSVWFFIFSSSFKPLSDTTYNYYQSPAVQTRHVTHHDPQ